MQKHLKKCIGCGVDLQNEDKEVIGYTPKVLKKIIMIIVRDVFN